MMQYKKIKSTDITLFTRQLATLVEAGIPLFQSFDILTQSQHQIGMRRLINELKHHIEIGSTLAASFNLHPRYFNDMYCNLIHTGEYSGALAHILKKLSLYREKTENMKQKIKQAMIYPAMVVAIGFIVSLLILLFVIPQFQTLFASFGAPLPAFTLLVIQLSRLIQNSGGMMLASCILISSFFVYFYRRSPRLQMDTDRLALNVFVFGKILRHAAITRFARTLSLTLAAGLPLYEALKLIGGATGHPIYSKAICQVHTEIKAGKNLQDAMTNTGQFPNMVIQMVAIGEESGTLEAMLHKVADLYEEEVNTALDNLSTLIEPVIICLLGMLVGGLVIAMYLPIFKLGSVV